MIRTLQLLCILVVGLTVAGCKTGRPDVSVQETAPADTMVAPKVAFTFVESPFLVINSDMMAEQFLINNLPAAVKSIDSATALDAVYQMLLDSLLGQDSPAFDLKVEDPSLYRQHLRRQRERTLNLLFFEEIRGKVVVSDSAVVATYEKQKDSFTVPREYRARHLVIAGHVLKKEDSLKYRDYTDEQMDSVAYGLIVDLRQRLLDGAPFDTLAMMYSHDPRTKSKGGDLGYFELASMVAPFDSAVEHTPVGQISGLVKTIFGWHVLRVESVSEPHVRPLDSVYLQIHDGLFQMETQRRSRFFVDSVIAAGELVLDSAQLQKDDSLRQGEDPVAYVNPRDLQLGNDTILTYEYAEQVYPYQRMLGITQGLTFEEKANLVRSVAVRFHLLRAARVLGHADSEDMRLWSANLMKKYCVATMRKRLYEDNYQPSEEEITAYYNEHISDYVVERPIYVQHIIFADSNLAEHVRDQLNSGADFMEMVDKYYPGDPEIRRSAADLGYIGEHDMPPEFWQVARITPEGQISSPVKTEYGYHIIKVREKNFPTPLENATPKIRPILMDRHREKVRRDFVESRLGGPPKIYWERLPDLYRKEIPPPAYFDQLEE